MIHRLFKRILLILDGHPKAFGHHQLGQSAAELALITPILLLLFWGIVEIGWFAQNVLDLQEVTRVGARRGAGLSGDLSPLAWSNQYSFPYYDPTIQTEVDQDWLEDWVRSWMQSYFPPSPTAPDPYNLRRFDTNGNGAIDSGGEEDTAFAIMNAESLNHRDGACFNPTFQGFYNVIICTMIDSMLPRTMKLTGTRPYDGPVGTRRPELDDIVISVFALQNINNARRTAPELSTRSDLQSRTFDFASNFDPKSGGDIAPENQPPAGWNVMVVGRYPTNANECNVASDGSIIPEDEQDRDPFDYITNGDRDLTPDGIWTAVNWQNPQQPYIELAGMDPWFVKEYHRGFSWRGFRRVRSADMNGRLCYGSEFSDAEVEELISLNNFGLTNDERSYLANHGLVLVELFWRHDLFLQIPGAIQVFGFFSDPNDIFIEAWAAFPALSVEPRTVFGPVN